MQGKAVIMLVDDDPINNLIIKKELSRVNADVEFIVFESATHALEFLGNNALVRPNLILLDINMPEMNGWEFLEHYEKLNLNINLAMLTSSISIVDEKKSINYPSIKRYFVKPLDNKKIKEIYELVS